VCGALWQVVEMQPSHDLLDALENVRSEADNIRSPMPAAG